jgi:restriction system protein
VHARQSAFAARDPEAVEWFVGCVLDASRYPDVFPREHQVTYRRKTRDVVVEFELPPPRIVPAARAFRYVSTRDAVEPVPRPLREIKQRYAKLVARIALRTLHEIFTATEPDVVDAVTFNGYVSSTDPATGNPVKPHLLSATVDRSALAGIVLAAVDPIACLTHLNAQLSPDPAALDPIHPPTAVP